MDFLILDVACWIGVSWLLNVLDMLEDILHQCVLVNNLMWDVAAETGPKGSMVFALNPLATQTCVTQTKILFLNL